MQKSILKILYRLEYFTSWLCQITYHILGRKNEFGILRSIPRIWINVVLDDERLFNLDDNNHFNFGEIISMCDFDYKSLMSSEIERFL